MTSGHLQVALIWVGGGETAEVEIGRTIYPDTLDDARKHIVRMAEINVQSNEGYSEIRLLKYQLELESLKRLLSAIDDM